MLLKYFSDGHPCLQEINNAYYESSTRRAYFVFENCELYIEGVSPSTWAVYVSDMFVDGKLSLPKDVYVDWEV